MDGSQWSQEDLIYRERHQPIKQFDGSFRNQAVCEDIAQAKDKKKDFGKDEQAKGIQNLGQSLHSWSMAKPVE